MSHRLPSSHSPSRFSHRARSYSSRRKARRQFTCDPTCNGQQHTVANDIVVAEQGLEGFFGTGLAWSGSIFYLYNSVYAFGCDYGHGQVGHAGDYASCVSCVDGSCGATQGGWDNIVGWKVNYGREFGSFGC